MRGAALLSGRRDAVVVDIGGTTSDVGVLVNGFPREASTEVDIGEVRTNFRMPDIISIGLGGGSIVRADGELTIGPDSVGYELQQRALVFGGDTLTTTDIAVAAGPRRDRRSDARRRPRPRRGRRGARGDPAARRARGRPDQDERRPRARRARRRRDDPRRRHARRRVGADQARARVRRERDGRGDRPGGRRDRPRLLARRHDARRGARGGPRRRDRAGGRGGSRCRTR